MYQGEHQVGDALRGPGADDNLVAGVGQVVVALELNDCGVAYVVVAADRHVVRKILLDARYARGFCEVRRIKVRLTKA